MYAGASACKCVCVRVHMCAPEVDADVFLYHSPTYILRLGLTLSLELTDLVTLGSH